MKGNTKNSNLSLIEDLKFRAGMEIYNGITVLASSNLMLF